jgi:hypothetical protein
MDTFIIPDLQVGKLSKTNKNKNSERGTRELKKFRKCHGGYLSYVVLKSGDNFAP